MTDFGTIGLGTMGSALLLNMLDHGFTVSGLDTSQEKAAKFLASAPQGRAVATTDMAAFVASIRRPRPILVLVPAGAPVDSVLDKLKDFLEPGDFVIDGGNSHYRDTNRRIAYLKSHGEYGFMGMGISGGEKGARFGPSMMPGGTAADYERVRPILESIAARHEGRPCVARVGDGSSGHYVKMVHNGIEYAMMQLLAEVYDVARAAGRSAAQTADLMDEIAASDAGGYLVEITAKVLRFTDLETGGPLVDVILDKAKGKGTGKWTSQDALDLGIPIPVIDASVTARNISSLKDLRMEIGAAFPEFAGGAEFDPAAVKDALRTAFLLAYAQGMHLIKAASDEYGFHADLRAIAAVWRDGCIIRSKLLDPVAAAIPALVQKGHLLHDPAFLALVRGGAGGLRMTTINGAKSGPPVPALSASLNYLDSLRSPRLPANLIQGQRDLFGAHTYERTDREGSFHTEWELSTPVAPSVEEGQVAPKKHSNE